MGGGGTNSKNLRQVILRYKNDKRDETRASDEEGNNERNDKRGDGGI